MSIHKRLAAPCALAAALLASAPEAPAQTSLSMRTRAIGASFGGIVEDLVSDSFLNPARLSAFSGTQLYVAKVPEAISGLPYPAPGSSYLAEGILPPEGYERGNSYSSAPYELTLFSRLGAGTRGAFTVAFGANSSDSYDETDSVSPSGSTALYAFGRTYGSRSEQTSFLLQCAISTGDSATARSLGLRLGLARNTSDGGSVESRTGIWLQPVSEAALDAQFDRRYTEFAQLEAIVTGGMYRPGDMLREFMLSVGYTSEEYDTETMRTRSEDNDYDGNGIGMNGPVYQFYSRARLTGQRSYDGPLMRGRLHMDLNDDLVLTAGGFYVYRTGSGPAQYRYDTILNDVGGRDDTRISTPYDYDGTDTRYGLIGTIGYRTRLTPTVLFALGASFQFLRDNFSETGNGRMDVEFSGTSIGSAEVDYTQKAWRVADHMYLRLPTGVEWLPVKPLAIRLGLEVVGRRSETTEVIRQEPDTSTLPSEYQRVGESQVGSSGDHLSMDLTTGLGLNLAERLFVDLQNRSSAVYLASFSYVSLRFLF